MSTHRPDPPPNPPTMASNASSATMHEYYTSFSFAVPTSLSAVKHLTWEQTPWRLPRITAKEAGVILPWLCKALARKDKAEAGNDSDDPEAGNDSDDPEDEYGDEEEYEPKASSLLSALTHAIPLGIAYAPPPFRSSSSPTLPPYINPPTSMILYILFPGFTHDISRNTDFLSLWHTLVVLPSFNSAWEDSGLVDVYSKYGTGGGRWTEKSGRGVGGILGMAEKDTNTVVENVRNGGGGDGEAGDRDGETRCVREFWPTWIDEEDERRSEGGGLYFGEGAFADHRAGVLGSAWEGMRGMLGGITLSLPSPSSTEGDGEKTLFNFSSPTLLLLSRSRTDFNPSLPLTTIYKSIGENWDRFVDARYIVEGSFKVVMTGVVGIDSDDMVEKGGEKAEKRGADGDREGRGKRRKIEMGKGIEVIW